MAEVMEVYLNKSLSDCRRMVNIRKLINCIKCCGVTWRFSGFMVWCMYNGKVMATLKQMQITHSI